LPLSESAKRQVSENVTLQDIRCSLRAVRFSFDPRLP